MGTVLFAAPTPQTWGARRLASDLATRRPMRPTTTYGGAGRACSGAEPHVLEGWFRRRPTATRLIARWEERKPATPFPSRLRQQIHFFGRGCCNPSGRCANLAAQGGPRPPPNLDAVLLKQGRTGRPAVDVPSGNATVVSVAGAGLGTCNSSPKPLQALPRALASDGWRPQAFLQASSPAERRLRACEVSC